MPINEIIAKNGKKKIHLHELRQIFSVKKLITLKKRKKKNMVTLTVISRTVCDRASNVWKNLVFRLFLEIFSVNSMRGKLFG